MRVYFLAEIPCALTVNGIFLGTVDGFERFAEIDPRDGVFCECAPAGCLPVRFRFDEGFLFSPPPQVNLYFSRGAVAVYTFGFSRADPTLSVLHQERIGGTLFTLYLQGKLFLSMENGTGFHLLPLPDFLSDSKPYPAGECYLLEGEHGFALLREDGEKIACAEGKVLERGESVKAELPFHDSAGHTALVEWKNGRMESYSIRTAAPPTESTFALALFESALIGADCTPYLAENLKEKAGSLKNFLGKYGSVVLTEEKDLVGLVYERKPSVFDVRYFRVTLSDGKISNIVEE